MTLRRKTKLKRDLCKKLSNQYRPTSESTGV